MRKSVNIIIIISLVISISGCATITGPSVDREELRRATEELKVKSLAFQIRQLERLCNIGNRLMLAIPKTDISIPAQPFLGIVCLEIDRYLSRAYNLNVDNGVVIIVVKQKSPAYDAGLVAGDVLMAINKIKISNINSLNMLTSKFGIGDLIEIQVLRGSQGLNLTARIKEIPVSLPIVMIDSADVNAATDGKSILVTYGLLNFVKSDDEIAAVLAHELAHAVRGHITKMQGSQAIGFLAALVLGIAAENSAPGSGEGVMRGIAQIGDIFNARYSRDLEREADYFGTRFVYYAGFDADACVTVEERFAIEIPATLVESYLSTHPSSPERMLRIRKIIEELKSGKPS